MPRTARVKPDHCSHHIMVRSIKELDLFADDADKVKYLELIKKYQLKYDFKIYAYCLMNNHAHLVIDSCGADISKIMHAINFSYARYFNKKYDRYGHVFQDRFKSKVVHDSRYMITLSAYIHNNPKDIAKYKNNVAKYPFSSLKEYLNGTDTFGILSRSLLADLIGLGVKANKQTYMNLVKESTQEAYECEIEFVDPETEYITHKKIIPRACKPVEIIAYVSSLLKQDPRDIYVKHKHSCSTLRALSCFLMSALCDMKHQEICEIIGDMTQSGISYLTSKGIHIVASNPKIIDDFPTP